MGNPERGGNLSDRVQNPAFELCLLDWRGARPYAAAEWKFLAPGWGAKIRCALPVAHDTLLSC
ncbi:hypothetical protein GCM10009762_17590 [Dermacoccus barathri]|uniref:Uncharacterized protein n=1 Tax=Dermacoccus barathri TaxID=322601 RepID=A0ABN2BNQ9_9MICO